MTMLKRSFLGLAAAFAASAALAQSAPSTLDAGVDQLARGWDHITYEVHSKPAQATQYDQLAGKAAALARQFPNRAEPLVWQAIILSTEAGAKGGLGALPLVKQAKTLLERAERLNPNAMQGSVYTSLGSLYYQVPGFPVGFGDPNKARAYLKKALAANPNGIDPNYFYGDFLLQQGQYADAVRALEHAAAAPARPGREVGDRGRRAEVAAKLAEARRKARG